MKRNTAPARAAVQLVMARCEGCCEVCGQYLSGNRGYDWSLHHRRPRSLGGTRRPETNLPANLIAICGSATTGCHALIESRREDAYRSGVLIRQNDDPSVVPVWLRHGWVLLADDGTWQETDPPLTAA